MRKFSHSLVESNLGLLLTLSLITISFAGLVQIVPLFFQHSTTTPLPTLKPYDALQLTGRDIYIREGCYLCHSQQVRKLFHEKLRYQIPADPGEGIYEHPFLWGSKRTGPDISRIGGRYSDEWHRLHLRHPQSLVPESVMPQYPFLVKTPADSESIQSKMKTLRTLGVPYSDEDIAKAPEMLEGKNEEDALVAYLQSLGLAIKEFERQKAGN